MFRITDPLGCFSPSPGAGVRRGLGDGPGAHAGGGPGRCHGPRESTHAGGGRKVPPYHPPADCRLPARVPRDGVPAGGRGGGAAPRVEQRRRGRAVRGGLVG